MGRTIRQTPIQIVAKLLEKIRQSADEWAGGERKFEKAVITMPSTFSQGQKDAIIDAARSAGFSEVHLISDSHAGN